MDPDSFIYLYKDTIYRLKLDFDVDKTLQTNQRKFARAVRYELDKLKYKYFLDLNGFIMGFGKIISKELSQANVEQYVNVIVDVDVFIFKILVGSILEGVVNQTSNNHISCLVRNVLNVSIIRPKDQSYDQWSGSEIKKDDNIFVRVLSYDLTKKRPHVIGEIVNKNDKCFEPKNEQENHSLQCPTNKSVSHFIKSSEIVKKEFTSLSSNFESSFETTTHFEKYGDISNKISLLFNQTANDNRNKNIKSKLFSSTPTVDTEHTMNSFDNKRNKRLEQLQKHNTGKLTNNQLNEFEKYKFFQSSNIFDLKNNINYIHNSECDLSALPDINNDNSGRTNINKANKKASLQNDSSISEDVHKRIKSSDQKFFSTPIKFKINQNSPESIEKNKFLNKIKFESIDPNSSERERNTVNYDLITSDKDNSVNTKHLPGSNEGILYNLSTKISNPFQINDNLAGSKIEIIKTQYTITSYSVNGNEIYSKYELGKSKSFTKTPSHHEMNFLNENDLSSNFLYDTSTLSSKLTKLNTNGNLSNILKSKDCNTNGSFSNILKTDDSNIDNISNSLSIKKPLRKKKKKHTNSTLLKSPKHNKLSSNFTKINNKDELIRLILGEDIISSSDDNINCTSSSKKNQISNVCNSKNNTNTIINKDISDSLCSENSTSFEDKELISKSNHIDHHYSKKKKNSMVEKEKNNLINLILTSIKNDNKKHKKSLPIKNAYSNSFKDCNKLRKVKHDINKDKSKNYKVPIKNEKKSNTLIQNVSQQCNLKHYKMQSSADDDSTDDDIELTKKKMKNQKCSKNPNVIVPELTIKNINCKEFIKKSKTKNNMDEIVKFQNTSRIKIDKVVSQNIIKKKSLKANKNILINSLINSMQNSSSCDSPKKRRKKVHNLIIRMYDKEEKKSKSIEDIINLILKS